MLDRLPGQTGRHHSTMMRPAPCDPLGNGTSDARLEPRRSRLSGSGVTPYGVTRVPAERRRFLSAPTGRMRTLRAARLPQRLGNGNLLTTSSGTTSQQRLRPLRPADARSAASLQRSTEWSADPPAATSSAPAQATRQWPLDAYVRRGAACRDTLPAASTADLLSHTGSAVQARVPLEFARTCRAKSRACSC